MAVNDLHTAVGVPLQEQRLRGPTVDPHDCLLVWSAPALRQHLRVHRQRGASSTIVHSCQRRLVRNGQKLRELAGNPVYTGRIVRSFHYEEAAPDLSDSVVRFHLVFADATKGGITLPVSAGMTAP